MSGSSNPEEKEKKSKLHLGHDRGHRRRLIDHDGVRRHAWRGHHARTVGGVVGDEVVLDQQHVGVDDGGATQLRPELVAGGAELVVELVGAVVEGLEAAAGVEVAVVGPGCGELLG
jgi:hypothetical protein